MFLDFSAGSVPVPTPYGLSALGTRLCAYEHTVAIRTHTPRILLQVELIIDTAPKERWYLDILEPQGESGLKEIVDHIKTIAADLRDNCSGFLLFS